MEIVRSKDVGTLQYDTYFNDDESQAIVLERFRDSDALILHGQNMAPLMESIMATGTVAEELAGDRPRRHDRLHEGGHVLPVQDQRAGDAEPPATDALGLVVVEVAV